MHVVSINDEIVYMEFQNQFNSDPSNEKQSSKIVLPDGSKKEQLGSGFITGLLGVGGMASVYEVWNSQIGASRAVKILHPDYTEETRQRFETEIKITTKLDHPNIIEVYGVGLWNGLPYIEMERLDGLTLDMLISQRGAFPTEVCTSIGIIIGRALHFAHNLEYALYGKKYVGVIHRDLKPLNIMVTYKGVLKLMDFGIARPTNESIHTTDGSILGTMHYLSPERLEGCEADIRTDIYSIGAVLYEMITGEKAFPGRDASKLMMSIIRNDFKPLECFNVNVPIALRKLVHRCLAHNPEKRYADTDAFLEEMIKVHAQLTDQSPEQILYDFICNKSDKRIVLSTRKKTAVLGITFSTMLILGLVSYVKYGILDRIEQPDNKQVNLQTATDTSSPPDTQNISPDISEVEKKKAAAVTSEQQPGIKNSAAKSNTGKTLPVTPKRTAAVKRSPSQMVVDSLRKKYATHDLKAIIEKEMQQQNVTHVLLLFDHLKGEDRGDTKMVIYTIRACIRNRDNKGLRRVLRENEVDDAEFYLEAAKVKLSDGLLSECLEMLSKSEKSSGILIDNKKLNVERLYVTAKCRSRQFDRAPALETRNSALDSWFEIKSLLRSAPQHAYFKEAVAEMQRITLKMNSIQK